MPNSSRNQWDAGRFVKTLSDFGEIPFIGSFRWLQKMAGKRTSFPGVNIEFMKKQVVVLLSEDGKSGRETSALDEPISGGLAEGQVLRHLRQELLKSPLNTSANFVLGRVAEKPGAWEKFTALVESADFTIVFGLSTLSTLLKCCEDSLGKTPDFVQQPVFAFGESMESVRPWGVLDDVVMGGVSQGGIALNAQGQAIFSGVVSTENSGGFSSVRTKNFDPPFNFSGWEGMRLVVRGDGQRYKFILRNSPQWDSPAYIYSFDTTAESWMTVDVPFADMVPTFRAKSVPNTPNLDPARVHSFQLMLSKFEYDRRLNPQFEAGSFSLAVSLISAYRQRQGAPLVIVTGKDGLSEEWQSTLSQHSIGYRWIELDDTTSNVAIEGAFTRKISELLDELPR